MSQSGHKMSDSSSRLILQNIIEETPEESSIEIVKTENPQVIQKSSAPEDSPSGAEQVEFDISELVDAYGRLKHQTKFVDQVDMSELTDAYERFKRQTRFVDTTETHTNCGAGCTESKNHKPMNRQQRRAMERKMKKAQNVAPKGQKRQKKSHRYTPINVGNKLSHRCAQMSTTPVPEIHLNAFDPDELPPLEITMD